MNIIVQIKAIWESLTKGDTYYGAGKDFDELFFSKLRQMTYGIYKSNKIGIATIVRVMWETHLRLVKTSDKLQKEHDELEKDLQFVNNKVTNLTDECNKIKVENWSLTASTTRTVNEQIENLESALNTSRYFIFLSGMSGFILGLLCIYFVV